MEEYPAGRKRRPKHSAASARFSGLVGGLDYSIDWDAADALLAPDVLTPAQWRPTRKFCACGCQRLLLEVLADAFRTLEPDQE
jgi:hypothetical protein